MELGKNALNLSSKLIVVRAPLYVIPGRIYDDGTESETSPGDCGVIPPGHNAWVSGNEPYFQLTSPGQRITQSRSN
jgi:hypothetical protein